MLRLRVQAATATGTGVLWLWVQACQDCAYGSSRAKCSYVCMKQAMAELGSFELRVH